MAATVENLPLSMTQSAADSAVAVQHSEAMTMVTDNDDQARKEGLRRRLMYKEWSAQGMTDLMNASTKCCKASSTWESVRDVVNDGLKQCDHIGAVGQVASNTMHVMSERARELNAEISKMEGRVVKEEVDVKRLRNVVKCERTVVDQRKELEEISAGVLKLPSRTSLFDEMTQLEHECKTIDEEYDELKKQSEKLATEVNLLLHCSESVELAAERLNVHPPPRDDDDGGGGGSDGGGNGDVPDKNKGKEGTDDMDTAS